jgi:FixJ family two-component response regulator
MVRAIRQVQAGRRVIPGPVLVARGNRNQQVAAQLSIAGETVRMHMKNIFGKLAAKDRAHAVTMAVTRGILRFPDCSSADRRTANA